MPSFLHLISEDTSARDSRRVSSLHLSAGDNFGPFLPFCHEALSNVFGARLGDI